MIICSFYDQTQQHVENGDIEEARKEFRTSFCCRLLGWAWFAVFISIACPLVLLAIVFPLVHHFDE